MMSTRVQIRIVALFYAVYAVLGVISIVTFLMMVSRTLPGSLVHEMGLRAVDRFPWLAAGVLAFVVLSGLAFRFMALSRSWQIATIAGSLYISVREIFGAVRRTFAVNADYWKVAPDIFGPRSIELIVYWAPVLAFLLCSYVLWRVGSHDQSD